MRRFKSTLVQRNHFKHPEDDESTTSSDADSTDSGSDAGTTFRCGQDVDSRSLFDVWSASRPKQGGPEQAKFFLPPGSRRRLTPKNIALASRIVCSTSYELLRLLSGLNPIRTAIMIFLTIIRGLLPAFRGYSQALILDEVQKLISSGDFPSTRLGHLLAREGFRMFAESIFDAFANDNESKVHASVRFLMEHRQLEQRLRLDIPTLADPAIRDLLHESDLFVRSFNGLGFGFGLFSPFDLIRVLSSLAEVASQLYVLYSTTQGSLPFLTSSPSSPTTKDEPNARLQAPLLAILILPTLFSLIGSLLPSFSLSLSSPYALSSESGYYSPSHAHVSERAERMRSLAHGEPFRAEVALFGLGPWILDSWASARKRILGLEEADASPLSGILRSETGVGSLIMALRWLLTQSNASEMIVLLQNLPFLLYASSTSLGSLALYRASLQSVVFTMRSLVASFERAFQSVFFMGAFFAAMMVEPKLSPAPEEKMDYQSYEGGMKIEARNISYTYPGNSKRTLNDVSFVVEAGEMLAIVGYNGSGKSTLANVLLRIFDYDTSSSPSDSEPELLINGLPIRQLDPSEYHSHVTALFQVFSKLNATVRENVGIGNVGDGFSDKAVEEAARRAGAVKLVRGLPRGLDTRLECMGLGMGMTSGMGEPLERPGDEGYENGMASDVRQGLSGGEWQRVAISRALMRARTADLLLLDEPTSHLDAHAQHNVLKSIDHIRRDPVTGKRTKTVIIITHQLSIARKADKIAMLENGSITEFGTHDELLARPNSRYGAMYRATAC
ncbi:P-loop containing nucleoside triphosphate hydrolase protein [Schizopora paradoxa]|uniref:p-loop containing nucleoside triphosphate hydrolase protein n=1 Tax=Schizopora paradoxa TaxID=27342 RepID=A0A0H2RVQ1_9AGAM|nr:P-loop containing nucleoside triphosphate hydrolase protein [Schizopora paradoxa]